MTNGELGTDAQEQRLIRGWNAGEHREVVAIFQRHDANDGDFLRQLGHAPDVVDVDADDLLVDIVHRCAACHASHMVSMQSSSTVPAN